MKRLLCIACVAAGRIGCAENKPAQLRPESAPYITQGRVQFESSTTKHIVHVVKVDTERTGSGLLKVILTMRNRTKKNLWVDVRTTFLDADGHVLDQSNWEPIMLDARTVSEYTCTSLNSQPADYQVIIRKPKKTDLELP